MNAIAPCRFDRGSLRNPEIPLRKTTAGLRWRLAAAGFPLAVLMILGAVASTASAQQATYNLTNYTGTDIGNSADSDTFTGTLTLSNIGTYTTANDSSVTLTYTFTLTSSSGSITPVTASGSEALSAESLFSGTLVGTSSTLTLDSGGDLDIQAGGGPPGTPYVVAEWEPQNNFVEFFAGLQGPPETMQTFTSSVGSSPFGSPNWTLGTVPEPGSAALALTGGIGLLVARRRRPAA